MPGNKIQDIPAGTPQRGQPGGVHGTLDQLGTGESVSSHSRPSNAALPWIEAAVMRGSWAWQCGECEP